MSDALHLTSRDLAVVQALVQKVRLFSQRQIVLGYYVFCTCFGALTLITGSQLFKFVALGVMGGLVALGFVVVNRVEKKREEKRRD